MPAVEFHGRLLDARPDRVDLRDRVYSPPLRALPPQCPSQEQIDAYLPAYSKLILDQGQEGACTGFGLAAVVNFLLWRDRQELADQVSPRMFYHLARMYDEWPGEDYEGSSCRGAMKGWHRHGVCREELWPYLNAQLKPEFVPPKEGWQQDAARRPLGAYYRIEKESIVDLQAAICEVGAIYVSARVHDGWRIGKTDKLSLIPWVPKNSGGHAFALVGYNLDGFIVQNSWGPDWGFHGFAVLTYEDWVSNGMDAWVAVLGAPVATSVPATQVTSSLLPRGSSRTTVPVRLRQRVDGLSSNPQTRPVSEETAYRHSVVMGNNGVPINRLLDQANGEAAVQAVSFESAKNWLLEQPESKRKLAIYAHGGLNDEPGSIRRVRVMLPYYLANGIYPIFVVWRTGLAETLLHILEDSMGDVLGEAPSTGLTDTLIEIWDRTLEEVAHTAPVRAIWGEMKQNALGGTRVGGAVTLLAKNLQQLRDQVRGLEIHLVGHSAGAILHGHLLSKLRELGQKARSVSLWAPACTVGFANDHYAAAIRDGDLALSNFVVELLSWRLEKDDVAGPYQKSLLYLISRALEDFHKTPVLGLQPVWVRQPDPETQRNLDEICSREESPSVRTWQNAMGGRQPKVLADPFSSNGPEQIATNHGSFDNNVDLLTRTLVRIRGSELAFPVDSLRDLPAGAFFSAPAQTPPIPSRPSRSRKS